MDYRRLALAAVAAWVVDCIYGFFVYGVLLVAEFDRYPTVFRPPDEVNGLLALMFGATLVGTFVMAYIFAKGHEGGNGLGEGFRFGVLLAAFGLFTMSIPNYVVYRYGRKLAVETAIAGLIEMILTGVVFGLIYRPLARPRATDVRRAIAV